MPRGASSRNPTASDPSLVVGNFVPCWSIGMDNRYLSVVWSTAEIVYLSQASSVLVNLFVQEPRQQSKPFVQIPWLFLSVLGRNAVIGTDQLGSNSRSPFLIQDNHHGP